MLDGRLAFTPLILTIPLITESMGKLIDQNYTPFPVDIWSRFVTIATFKFKFLLTDILLAFFHFSH